MFLSFNLASEMFLSPSCLQNHVSRLIKDRCLLSSKRLSSKGEIRKEICEKLQSTEQ